MRVEPISEAQQRIGEHPEALQLPGGLTVRNMKKRKSGYEEWYVIEIPDERYPGGYAYVGLVDVYYGARTDNGIVFFSNAPKIGERDVRTMAYILREIDRPLNRRLAEARRR